MKTKLLCGYACLWMLSGCELVNQQVLMGFRQFFPSATIVRHANAIEIETHIYTGVGRQLCIELFQSFRRKPEFPRMAQAFHQFKYQALAVNLGEFTVIWVANQPEGFRVVTRAESNNPDWPRAPLIPFQ